MAKIKIKNRTFLVQSQFGTYPFNNRKTAEQLTKVLTQYEKDLDKIKELTT